MSWQDGTLVIDIDEVTVPFPGRLRAPGSADAATTLRPYGGA